MAQYSLGRTFNTVPAADNKWINLQDAGSVAFLCYLTGAAGDTYTVTQAQDAAGTGAKALTKVGTYYTATGDGSDTWVARTPTAQQQAAGTVVTAAQAAQNAAVFEVLGVQLDEGFTHIRVASTGAGTVNALLGDLMSQRAPEKLAAVSA
ncbi:hypothetical protein [Streptomyces tremellae]|uniref:Phage tail protein n=1 Tax=Streptomyces tremellae TaxID=1124239 RepID=A0ABP7EEX3_9ACTN